MAKYKTYIVVLEAGANKGREDLEEIEGTKFDSKEGVRRVLCFDEYAPVETEKLRIYTLSEFTEVFNNTDDDTLEDDDKFEIKKLSIGFVQIRE